MILPGSQNIHYLASFTFFVQIDWQKLFQFDQLISLPL